MSEGWKKPQTTFEQEHHFQRLRMSMRKEEKKEIEDLKVELEAVGKRLERLEEITDLQQDALLYIHKQLANNEFFVKLTKLSKN